MRTREKNKENKLAQYNFFCIFFILLFCFVFVCICFLQLFQNTKLMIFIKFILYSDLVAISFVRNVRKWTSLLIFTKWSCVVSYFCIIFVNTRHVSIVRNKVSTINNKKRVTKVAHFILFLRWECRTIQFSICVSMVSIVSYHTNPLLKQHHRNTYIHINIQW